MKLSTRARYGLKAMVDLAERYGGGMVSTSALAALQGISDAYLEQLIAALRRAGLVVDVLTLPANNVYVVRGGEREWMIPAVPEFVAEVNIDEGYMRINLMEGL